MPSNCVQTTISRTSGTADSAVAVKRWVGCGARRMNSKATAPASGAKMAALSTDYLQTAATANSTVSPMTTMT